MSAEIALCPRPESDATPGAALVPVSARVGQLLAGFGVHAVFSEDGHHFVGTREDWAPQAVTPAERGELVRQAALLDDALRPVERGVLLARVLGLLAHYRQDALPPEVERALAADWAEDLSEFPRWAIDDACRSWRRDPKRYRFRPLPGDLRQLCRAAVAEAEETRRRVRVLLGATAAAPVHQIQQRVAALVAEKRRK